MCADLKKRLSAPAVYFSRIFGQIEETLDWSLTATAVAAVAATSERRTAGHCLTYTLINECVISIYAIPCLAEGVYLHCLLALLTQLE